MHTSAFQHFIFTSRSSWFPLVPLVSIVVHEDEPQLRNLHYFCVYYGLEHHICPWMAQGWIFWDKLNFSIHPGEVLFQIRTRIYEIFIKWDTEPQHRLIYFPITSVEITAISTNVLSTDQNHTPHLFSRSFFQNWNRRLYRRAAGKDDNFDSAFTYTSNIITGWLCSTYMWKRYL